MIINQNRDNIFSMLFIYLVDSIFLFLIFLYFLTVSCTFNTYLRLYF